MSHRIMSQDEKTGVIEVARFDFDGYQVVRGEFFAHLREPAFVFNKDKIYVNSACIKKMPDTEFIQILINREQKIMVVRPCDESEKDSFRWNNPRKGTPRQIISRIFIAKVYSLMQWDYANRYKLLGKLIKSNDEYLSVFDLKTPEVYQPKEINGKIKTSRTPSYPEEWANQFGVTLREHQENLHINLFEGYVVFDIDDEGRGINA